MVLKAITYKINQAKRKDILNHLRVCNDSFFPPLNQKVDINSYSQKIFVYADTFEAWDEDQLIGLVAVYCNDVKPFITNVSVIEKFYNRGVASKLLEMCIEYVKSRQFKDVTLEVNERSEKAISLYERFDFQKVELNHGFILMRCEI